MESSLPIQCDEISSTVPDGVVPEDDDVQVVGTVDRRDRLEVAALKRYARQLIAILKLHCVYFLWKDEETAMLAVGRKNIQIQRKNPGLVVVSFINSAFFVNVTTMSLLKVTSFLLEYFLEAFNYNLFYFHAKSIKVSADFTIPRKLKVFKTCFDSSKQEAEQLMDFWMPHFEFTVLVHVGDVLNDEHQERCLRIYHKHFHGKTKGWMADAVPASTANALRRLMPAFTTPEWYLVHENQVPIGVVIRWIKGWLLNTPGYTHLECIVYRSPHFKPHTGIFRFLGYPVDVPSKAGVVHLTRVDGRMALLEIRKGEMAFRLCSGPLQKDFENDLVYNFSLDDLADDDAKWPEYVLKDQIDYRNLEDYGTPKVRKVPKAPQQ